LTIQICVWCVGNSSFTLDGILMRWWNCLDLEAPEVQRDGVMNGFWIAGMWHHGFVAWSEPFRGFMIARYPVVCICSHAWSIDPGYRAHNAIFYRGEERYRGSVV